MPLQRHRRSGWRRAALLGVVQGVAEVVPVSSSAQLTLLPWLLRHPEPADRTLEAALLHAGSCAGIGWALRTELRGLAGRELALLGAASVPAAVAGLLAADTVERRLGRPPQLAVLLAGAGALLWIVDRRAGDGNAQVTSRSATWAALAQPLALVPGVSRSGATLTALRAAGVARPAAERFALLMSLPVTAGAAGLTLWRAARTQPDPAQARRRTTATVPSALAQSAPGLLAAAVTAAATVTRRRRHPPAGYGAPALYRLTVATAVAVRLAIRRQPRGEAAATTVRGGAPSGGRQVAAPTVMASQPPLPD